MAHCGIIQSFHIQFSLRTWNPDKSYCYHKTPGNLGLIFSMAPTPVLLPGKSHGQRSLVGCRPWGREESGTTERLHFHFSLSCIGEGNGNPLQCSCLENPRDGGAWWAAIYGVAQSRTQLKWLSSSSSSILIKNLLDKPYIHKGTYPLSCLWVSDRGPKHAGNSSPQSWVLPTTSPHNLYPLPLSSFPKKSCLLHN